MEQIWIKDKLRTVPPALFSKPDSRQAIAAWAADPDGVEAELAKEAKQVDESIARRSPAERIRQEAANREAGVRSSKVESPPAKARAPRAAPPSTDAQE